MRLFVNKISSFLAKAIHKIFQEPRPHFLGMFGRFQLIASSCHEYLLFPLGGIWQFGTKPYFYPTTAQLVHIAYSLNLVIGWLITDTYWHVLTRTYTYWQLTLTDTYWQPTITRSPKLQKGTRLHDMTKSKLKSACATSA